jgi:hypothetical protein
MRAIMVAVSGLAACLAGAAAAQEGGALGVELNKLESIEGGCRSYFLFRNETGRAMSAFELSVAVLGTDGVIDQLLTIDAAPLPAARTTLKIFEIPDTACASIGEILLHDIPACTAEDGEPADCFSLIALSSLAEAPLFK